MVALAVLAAAAAAATGLAAEDEPVPEPLDWVSEPVPEASEVPVLVWPVVPVVPVVV